jgi:hypothetical protein
MDGSNSVLCPMARFDISDVEPQGADITLLVTSS